ncbi:MAG: homoserine O-succinyltransferase [Lysobacterales bacterium]
MPLVAHSNLPTFARLREQGQQVLTLERAEHQDIRELHIGLLNMMPDAALKATEEQFIRLVGNCNQIAQFFVYPFTLPVLPRSKRALEHIGRYYSSFDELRTHGLDALIITGANVTNPALSEEPFWEPLVDIIEWAHENVASTLCSCLATHALVKHLYGIERQPLPSKQWGVYSHKVTRPAHPLTKGINTRFDAPHSRWNEISREQCEQAGLSVLACSVEAGVHLAVSRDQFSIVYFQGHPEYDANSLLKEYKREVSRYLQGDLAEPPVFPENYFSLTAETTARRFIDQANEAREAGRAPPDFPEAELALMVDDTWGDTGKAIVNNWLGLVYQVTNVDRHKRFMDGIDPEDPLGLRSKSGQGERYNARALNEQPPAQTED